MVEAIAEISCSEQKETAIKVRMDNSEIQKTPLFQDLVRALITTDDRLFSLLDGYSSIEDFFNSVLSMGSVIETCQKYHLDKYQAGMLRLKALKHCHSQVAAEVTPPPRRAFIISHELMSFPFAGASAVHEYQMNLERGEPFALLRVHLEQHNLDNVNKQCTTWLGSLQQRVAKDLEFSNALNTISENLQSLCNDAVAEAADEIVLALYCDVLGRFFLDFVTCGFDRQ